MTFEDYCRQNNIVVVFYNFSTKVKGLSIKIDDYFIIALNSRMNIDSQKKTLEHELIHIMENHFQYSDYEECEKEVCELIKDYDFRF